MTVKITGLAQVAKSLAKLPAEIDKAAISAQNKMAFRLKYTLEAQMRTDLDRPKPYSLSAIRYDKARKGKPAYLYVVDKSTGDVADEQSWIGVQVGGGTRRRLRHSERRFQEAGLMPRGWVWVPTKFTKLDKWGNVPGSLMVAILGTRGRRSKKYFVLKDRGVYEKLPGRVVRPILLFVSPREYNKRYDFFGRARKEVAQNYPRIAAEQVERAMKRI